MFLDGGSDLAGNGCRYRAEGGGENDQRRRYAWLQGSRNKLHPWVRGKFFPTLCPHTAEHGTLESGGTGRCRHPTDVSEHIIKFSLTHILINARFVSAPQSFK